MLLVWEPVERERGAVIVFFALVLVVLLSMVAFVVDVGRIYWVRAHLKTTADASALAAATQLPDVGAVVVEAVLYGQLNYPGAVAGSDVTVGYWDTDAETFYPGAAPSNAVRVWAQRSKARGNPVELYFAPVFGIYESEIGAVAVARRSLGGGSRFLIDNEMFDTDIPAIEAVAVALGVTSDDLLGDADGDWFVDFYDYAGSIQIELPTGQVGDEALFDIDHSAFPFSQSTVPSFEDFLNYNEDGSWRQGLIPATMLDPLLGVSVVDDASLYPSYIDPAAVQVSPLYTSDTSNLGPIGGIPAVNALGERRGLIAFRIIAVGSDPDGPSGSALPNLIIELVNPDTVSLSEITPSGGTGGVELVD